MPRTSYALKTLGSSMGRMLTRHLALARGVTEDAGPSSSSERCGRAHLRAGEVRLLPAGPTGPLPGLREDSGPLSRLEGRMGAACAEGDTTSQRFLSYGR